MYNISPFSESHNIPLSLDDIFEEAELWYLTVSQSGLVGYYAKPDLTEQSPRVSLTEYFGGDQEKGGEFYSNMWKKILSLSQDQFTEFVTQYYPRYLTSCFDQEDIICISFDFLSLFLRDEPVSRNNAEYFFSNNKQLFDFSMYIFRHVQEEWIKRGEVYYAQEVERQIKPLMRLNQ